MVAGATTSARSAVDDRVEQGHALSPSPDSRENLDKIFLPLFTTKARGIGLGQAISKSLAEASGGTLEAESEPRQGTRLTLTFPDLGDGAGDDRPA